MLALKVSHEQFPKMAIIEKDNLDTKTPVKEK